MPHSTTDRTIAVRAVAEARIQLGADSAAIDGQVQDQDGRAVSGASVFLVRSLAGMPQRPLFHSKPTRGEISDLFRCSQVSTAWLQLMDCLKMTLETLSCSTGFYRSPLS